MLPRPDHCTCLFLALRWNQSISPRCGLRILPDPFDPLQVLGIIQSLNHILQPRRENGEERYDRLPAP